MKKITLILCFGVLSLISFAQPEHKRPEQIDIDEIIRMQTRDLVMWMKLDETVEKRFVKEYTAFRKEIDAVAKKALPPQKIEEESEIEKAILQNFEVSEQILQIRKKYYSRFKEFLQPSQIQMMYRLENEAGRRMHGGPGGPGAPEGHRPGGHGPGAPDMPGGPGHPEEPGRF